ncbi:MAG: HEPN domain-containing protein [Planctomycetes bacterium]|nr:HEPN domain-containing protein [Planctomycetota bacterium]
MAEALLQKEFFEGVAFHSQQSGQKGSKGLLLEKGEASRTHSCVDLLERLKELGESPPEEVVHHARALDKDYVPSRYPNGVGGEPEKFYDRKMANESLGRAREIGKWVESRRTTKPS